MTSSSRAALARSQGVGFALSIALAVCFFWPNRAVADDACPDSSQDIATDRPSVTNSSLVVPTGSLQDENEINWTTRPEGRGLSTAPTPV